MTIAGANAWLYAQVAHAIRMNQSRTRRAPAKDTKAASDRVDHLSGKLVRASSFQARQPDRMGAHSTCRRFHSA
jgi:hypothetical protein